MERPFEESWFSAPLRGTGDRFLLPAEESHHLRKVLRLPMGRQVVASNGEGGVFICATRGDGERVELEALESKAGEPRPPRLNLVLSLLKGRDLEEPVEGLCQLPIHRIFLVTTDHTQEFKGQNHDRLVERLRGKSLVALKQAKKAWLTEILAPVPLRAWRAGFPAMPLVLLHPGADRMPDRIDSGYAVLAGPEGGLSAAELAWLEQEGCHTLSLGGTRLRGTHAPLVACGKLMGLGILA